MRRHMGRMRWIAIGSLAAALNFGCRLEEELIQALDEIVETVESDRSSEIADGTSNTILDGQNNAAAPGGSGRGGSAGGSTGGTTGGTTDAPTSPPAPGTGAPTTPSAPGTGTPTTPPPAPSPDPAIDTDAMISELTQLFGNTRSTFGRSSGSSDNDRFLTGNNDLTLCANGRFFLRETLIFSSADSPGFTSENDSVGTWAIVVLQGNLPAIELRVEQSSDQNQAAVLQFLIAADDRGRLFLNERLASVETNVQSCQ